MSEVVTEYTTKYLGKMVDLTFKDGSAYSGYVFEVYAAEDSDMGCDSIEISPLETMHTIEFAIEEIADIQVDDRFRTFDFRH